MILSFTPFMAAAILKRPLCTALRGIARGVANLKVFQKVHTNEKMRPLLYGKRCPVDPLGSLGITFYIPRIDQILIFTKIESSCPCHTPNLSTKFCLNLSKTL